MTSHTEALTQVESLKFVADEYIDHAVSIGKLTMSHIMIRGDSVSGFTTTETDSGVGITKHSNGLLAVHADFEEPTTNGATHDLTRRITISPDDTVEITDTRDRIEDGQWTGEGGSRTLSKRDHDSAIAEMVKLVKTVY